MTRAARQELDQIALQASEWLVRLMDDEAAVSEADRVAFETWKQADPRHGRAINRLDGLVTRLRTMPPGPARRALEAHEKHSQRTASKLLTLMACALLPLWLLWPSAPVERLFADVATGGGEWRTLALEDSSSLTLAANSAVDLRFTGRERRIALLQGEILANVAKDPARPFIVETNVGAFEALGTRFTVRMDENAVELAVIESRVAVLAAQLSGERPVIEEGQRLTLYRDRIGAVESMDPLDYEAAWQARQLVVLDQPLVDVLQRLSAQYPGYLRYDSDALAELRVSAVLPLDEPERALVLLERSLPIRMTRLTDWWVRIQPAETASR